MQHNKFRTEITRLLFAHTFYTRLPIPHARQYTKEDMAQSVKYLPLVGLTIGLISASAYWLAIQILPASISVVLAMVATILATGAFHEDGFADVCDAFGGGWERQRILDIMKDSHIGAYGTIGICMILLAKFTTLREIDYRTVPCALIAGHVASRWAAVWFMYTHTYARADETSKSSDVAKPMSASSFLIASAITIAVLAWMPVPVIIAAASIPVTKLLFARYINKWIGGYTGDTLGATQQLSEVLFYISILIVNALY